MSKIKAGYYSAVYFLKTANILKNEKPSDIVTMQFFSAWRKCYFSRG
nr:hypothetical protein [Spiroplasma poulsonii]